MRKLLPLLVLVLLAGSSCKKKYTCQCTDKASGLGTRSFTVTANSFDDADVECARKAAGNENCAASY